MSSRFDDIIKAKRQAPESSEPPPSEAPTTEPIAPAQAPPPSPAPVAIPPAPPATSKRKGKKDNPEYQQVTAYVRRDLYRRVQGELFNNHDRKEFSELVDELLAEWLERQTSR